MTDEKVTIDKLAITVNELTMQQIADLMKIDEENATTSVIKLLEATTNIKASELMPLKPSEIQGIVDKMVEVNTPFLSQQRAIGNDLAAEALEKLLRSVCMIAFLPSLPQDTE